jgi:UDP-N-acetylglucosamine--N-acetylmuramyl-(pentapeptide) pyrophosphoryl-undecaprenol N-acetylglucosamine transferase
VSGAAPFVLFAGGGTGGHVFPLVALAEAFERLAPDVAFAFVGTERGLEARVIPSRGWTLETLPVEPMKGRSILGALRGGAIAATATVRAASLVRRLRPSIIVSIGGYAAGPVTLAAATLGVPVALLEPNRIAGLTQRLSSPLAKRVYVGFVEAGESLGEKARAFGVPMRSGFSPVEPRKNQGELHILVMGGSQGAQHLNETMPLAIARLGRDVEKMKVIHQAGRDRSREVKEKYARAWDAEAARGVDRADEDAMERARRKGAKSPPAEIVEFMDDVQARLAWADVVVSRSGAMTCAELCAVGRPAIFVPYPFAADDHQAKNAEALAKAGAAIAMRQESASPEAIANALGELARDEAKRIAMADAARARGIPDAAEIITRDLLDLMGLAPKKRNGDSEAADHV